MTTRSKAGAHKPDAEERDVLERDELDPTVQLESAGARDTRPIDAIPPDAEDQPEASDDADDEAATVLRQSVRQETPSKPRKNTLAMAITRPVRQDERGPDATPPGGVASQPATSADAATSIQSAKSAARSISPVEPAAPDTEEDAEVDEGEDGVTDEVDEWAVADQPTVYLSPRSQPSARPPSPRPAFLDTGEGHTWPPRPARAGSPSDASHRASPVRPDERQQTPTPRTPLTSSTPPVPPARPAAPSRPGTLAATGGARLASPTGRPMPGTPPAGVPRAALPNPRMQRFQELRGQLEEAGTPERLRQESRPVAEVVRRWWHDLQPGLEGALRYQREARESGVHPIPAHVPTTTSRLGDAFGRVAASARDLTGRAQAAAAPALKRLHAQAEQAAQALVDRIEGSPARQQFPLLGPGRIAVFFKQGVTVGQAQKLLSASQARPIRLIPRKHGFLALVPPGAEAEVAERLRVHPYVRDVAYLEYDEYGQPVRPER